MVDRMFVIGCLVLLLFGCTSKAQKVNPTPWTGGSGLPPPPIQQPAAAAARESDVSPIHSPSAASEVPAPPTDAATGKVEVLGEMSDSTPGAAKLPPHPCNLDTCAVVLGIATSEAAESLAQDNGGPGVYVPEGAYSAETAGIPGVRDAYGVEKLVPVWDVTVRLRNGTVQTIQQRTSPAFKIGDPVLVNGNSILPWN